MKGAKIIKMMKLFFFSKLIRNSAGSITVLQFLTIDKIRNKISVIILIIK